MKDFYKNACCKSGARIKKNNLHIQSEEKNMCENEVKVENAEEVVYEDITLTCRDCGEEFVFTAGEQQFYAEKGFKNQPKCCKACRDKKKNAERGERQYFIATCSECGGEAKLTFQPSSDRPVYCSKCFEARRSAQ
jgi:CxxC-x17-CxxC domain-containing protein